MICLSLAIVDVIKMSSYSFSSFLRPKMLGTGCVKAHLPAKRLPEALCIICQNGFHNMPEGIVSFARRISIIRLEQPVLLGNDTNPFCLPIKFLQANDVSRFGQATYVHSLAWKVHHRHGEVRHFSRGQESSSSSGGRILVRTCNGLEVIRKN